jgi:hypothetical protein
MKPREMLKKDIKRHYKYFIKFKSTFIIKTSFEKSMADWSSD